MKQSLIICTSILFLLMACSQRDKTKILSRYKYDDNSGVLTVNINKEFDSWVKEGIKCYGIIMVCDLTGNPLRIKEVHVQIIKIQPGKIKLETLEDVIINRKTECTKVSFKKGESWDEEYGEIFKTREEAIKYMEDCYPGLRKVN